ncbi:MAG TPA: PQQ-dependent sugar dehydrogenase [Myxococcaceae bacterium]|nr:PQQ-dependent sugar dehydrogenase [Myxococcaceae bacterium]
MPHARRTLTALSRVLGGVAWMALAACRDTAPARVPEPVAPLNPAPVLKVQPTLRIVQGRQATLGFSVERGEPGSELMVALDPLPQGLAATPTSLLLPPESSEGLITLTADPSAPLGERTVALQASSPNGVDRQLVAVEVITSYGLDRREQDPALILPSQLATAAADEWEAIEAFPGLLFREPVYLAEQALPERAFYLLERHGRLLRFQGDAPAASLTTFLDLRDRVLVVGQDDGMLGLVFHPEFGRSGAAGSRTLFLFYTARSPAVPSGRTNRLSRFQVSQSTGLVDPATETVLIEQEDEHEWHNGGSMHFGADGFLYLSVGDEGLSRDVFKNSQRIDKDLFSGVLRIDVDCRPGVSRPIGRQPLTGVTAGYCVPNDNPFVGTPGALEEFWAVGLRSPHRMSFDRVTGKLWLGEVGQNAREEVEVIERGTNHQWVFREGTLDIGQRPATVPGREKGPVFEYPHSDGNGCIIGGHVYRGARYPELTGNYIYADTLSGRIWALETEGPDTGRNLQLGKVPDARLGYAGVTSFGEDLDGELYLLQLGAPPENGRVMALRRRTPSPVAEPPALLSQTGVFADLATLTPSTGFVPYDVASPLWSDGAAKRRWIHVPRAASIGFRTQGPWRFPPGTTLVKHFDLPLDASQPSRVRRLETRLIVFGADDSFYGITYRWDESGTDARLLTSGQDASYEVVAADGTTRTQVWHFPSRSECLSCHRSVTGGALGVKTAQLNRTYRYPKKDLVDDQLRAWSHAGLLAPPLDEAELAGMPRLAPLEDAGAPLEARARSYLDANCSHCHQPNSGVRAAFDARYETPLTAQGLVNALPEDNLGIENARIIWGGDPERSTLYQRMVSTDPAVRMPALGRAEPDRAALEVLRAWIAGLGP